MLRVPFLFRFIHTNDMHGTMSPKLFEQLKTLRASADLYFDTGDSIRTGNLGIPLRPDPVWSMFEELQLTASVLGNRETHPLKSAAEMKVSGAKHPILVSNMTLVSGRPAYEIKSLIDCQGLRIGVFGVMVPMATERMKTSAAWSYRWQLPIPAAIKVAEELRPQCDVLIALTHIGHREDVRLAEATDKIDIILGGHSHTVIQTPERVGRTWICQGGSHNRFVGVYEWSNGELRGGLQPLRSSTR
jgi:5'-nucleotidase